MSSKQAGPIFISRAGADSGFAAEIASCLKEAGYEVVLQQWNFTNRNFINEMHDAISRSSKIVVLLSPEYLESDYCKAEWQNAIAGDPLNRKGRLVVLRVSECTPEGLLAGLAYWDLVAVRGNTMLVRSIALQSVQSGRQAGPEGQFWRTPSTILHKRIRPVPNFSGRSGDLALINEALWNPKDIDAPRVAICGLGGMGKSATAIEYAYRNKDKYCGVWWIDGEHKDSSTTGAVDGLTELAKLLFMLQTDFDKKRLASQVIKFVDEGGHAKPWLLIFDNAEQPNDIDEWLPRAAHVIITTRWPDWQGRAHAITLDVFSQETAVAFLLKRASRTDEQGAGILAEALGQLPLALDHAGAYCKRSGTAFAKYAELLPSLFKTVPPGADYPRSVAATFGLALELAMKAAPSSERVLRFLAFLSPTKVPLNLLSKRIGEEDLGGAVATLIECALVSFEPNQGNTPKSINIHRLVQAAMRSSLESANLLADSVADTVALIADALGQFDFADARSADAIFALMPHLAAAEHYLAPTNPRIGEYTRAWTSVGEFYLEREKFDEAVRCIEPVLKIDRERRGLPQSSKEIIRSMILLARAECGRANYEAADNWANRALAGLKPSGWDGKNILNELAESLQGKEDDFYNIALAEIFNVLSEVELSKRSWEEALAYAKCAVLHGFTPKNPKHRATKYWISCARAAIATEQIGDVEKLYRTALKTDLEECGQDNFRVARDRLAFGTFLIICDRISEAETLLRDAYLVYKEYNCSAWNFFVAYKRLFDIKLKTNNWKEAWGLWDEAHMAMGMELWGINPKNDAFVTQIIDLVRVTKHLASAKEVRARALVFLPGYIGNQRSIVKGIWRLQWLHEHMPLFSRLSWIGRLYPISDPAGIAITQSPAPWDPGFEAYWSQRSVG